MEKRKTDTFSEAARRRLFHNPVHYPLTTQTVAFPCSFSAIAGPTHLNSFRRRSRRERQDIRPKSTNNVRNTTTKGGRFAQMVAAVFNCRLPNSARGISSVIFNGGKLRCVGPECNRRKMAFSKNC